MIDLTKETLGRFVIYRPVGGDQRDARVVRVHPKHNQVGIQLGDDQAPVTVDQEEVFYA